MLNKEQIEENKDTFLKLISEINIEGVDTQGLVDYLLTNDFFTAPASTQYHCNFEGGLCYHSLNVYKILFNLADMLCPGKYDDNSLKIVGLLHDISKTGFYEKYIVNKKIYNEGGTKHDNQGSFDWFAEEAYKVKDASERFLGGEHGLNSMFIANQYIPLSYEEMIAIIHHHFISDTGSTIKDITPIYNKYTLAALVHCADMLACYVIEPNQK